MIFKSRMIRVALATTVLAAAVTTGVATADPASGHSHHCPGLYVLAVQGTGQSSPDAPVSVDSGMLSRVLEPVMSAVGYTGLGREYVPYAASFGGAVPGGTMPYSASAEGGLKRLQSMAHAAVDQCPLTQLAVIGYSQGAHIVSMFAREVGQGRGTVSADQVAAVALIADPTRIPGAPPFPGAPGKTRPDPAPGTAGTAVSTLQVLPLQSPPGGGIGPEDDLAPDFGTLSGRVASLCLPGDLACDAPTHAPLLHMIATILGQAELLPSDPITALNTILETLIATVSRTATAVIDHDLQGNTLGTLHLTPEKTLSMRLAEAADPRTVDDPQARIALLKLGTSAINTLLAILGIALTPAEVAAVAGCAALDPLAAMHRIATTIATAAHRPAPERPAFRLITQTLDALGTLGPDNAALLDPRTWLRYADTGHRHSEYTYATYTSDGQPATRFIIDWLTALARDLSRPRIHPYPAGPRAVPPYALPGSVRIDQSQPAPATVSPPGIRPTPASGTRLTSSAPAIERRPTVRNSALAQPLRVLAEDDNYLMWSLLLALLALTTLSNGIAWCLCRRPATRTRRPSRAGEPASRYILSMDSSETGPLSRQNVE